MESQDTGYDRKMGKSVKIGKTVIGGKSKCVLIAGPCVIEGRKSCIELAGKLSALALKNRIPFVFKASFDKANRSSHRSYRGPGIAKGLEILSEIKEKYKIPVLTDIHSEHEVDAVARVVDVLQIPAFLCRQTDLIVAAGESGKPVNIKKGQFLAPGDIVNIIAKIESTGNKQIILTERGTSFGYNNLVVDMRSLAILADTGYPVVFDATHSVQRPGGAGSRSSGEVQYVELLARAAVAAGCDGVFMETHMSPAKAMSDKDNTLPFSKVGKLWKTLSDINRIVG